MLQQCKEEISYIDENEIIKLLFFVCLSDTDYFSAWVIPLEVTDETVKQSLSKYGIISRISLIYYPVKFIYRVYTGKILSYRSVSTDATIHQNRR